MNLKNIDIEELDKLPHRQKFYHVNINGRKERALVARKQYKYRYPVKLQQCARILEGYVDRPISELRARIKPIFVPSRRMATIDEFINRYVEQVMFLPNGEVKAIPTYSWRNIDTRGYLYVDVNDTLRRKKSTYKRPTHKIKTPQEQTAYIIGERRRRKELRQTELRISMKLLSLINKPLVLTYYRNLASEYKSLEKQLRMDTWRIQYKREKGQKLDMWDRITFSGLPATQERLYKLQAEMSLFESGDLAGFYRSNVYLRAIALEKECHHFGDSPHKEPELI